MIPYSSSLLLFLCCTFFFVLPNINGANQADRLRELIRSEMPSSSSHHDLSTELLLSSRVLVSNQEGKMEADKIGELPGQPKGVDFNQYAGYVTVNEKNGRALFYYFVESSQDSATKPLVLWLNGGPGCSSLAYGAFEELGPFRVNSDGKTLTRNHYAWNNVANVIFLESPAGVGFSYSNTTSDYDKSGDNRTAADNYVFLLNWLERFPQYKTRDFFITGESYAGHYIPELAHTIIHNNKIANQSVVNLRGVAIGNAYVDQLAQQIGTYEYYWSHAIMSDDTYAIIQSSCNFASQDLSNECVEATNIADQQQGNIDDYNIYAPNCDGSNSSSGVAMADFDPCSDNYVFAYFNNPLVQKALHANVTELHYAWDTCTGLFWNDMPSTVLPIIRELISSGLKFWLFSGDVDAVVPITSTRHSIKMLGLPIKVLWRPWYLNQEVGGYVEEYQGLTLATVRGSGHMVPSYQPARALAMISSFLKGQLPPSNY